MSTNTVRQKGKQPALLKAPTGIRGLDDITQGGLPRSACTLVCGGPGSGKTIFGLEFLFHGIMQFKEPGVLLTFEESRQKLGRNVSSLGIVLDDLVTSKKLAVDPVRLEPHDQETGGFTLDGLFIRLDQAIKSVNAKRVAIDGIDTLFGAFSNRAALRAELSRLFRWLEEQKVSSLVTSEKGEGSLTRHGLEEYLADCVIYLDHRISEHISTRRLRVLKYRGSQHSADEFPFTIDKNGINVLPVTSIGLNHPATTERVPSGLHGLDEMLEGKGFFKGSSILISGTAGTGKTSIAASFVHAAAVRGERALYFAFEESQDQIIRNMRSIGLDLLSCVRNGRLQFANRRPSVFGLESHLNSIQESLESFNPSVVVVDPVSNFSLLGNEGEVRSMLMRLIDFLKARQITALFTSLTEGGTPLEQSSVGVSSLIDTWVMVRDLEHGGERNRGLYLLKSRGMAHSNQIRELMITSNGLKLLPVFIGPEGVLTGSARIARQAEEQAKANESPSLRRKQQDVRELRRKSLEAELAALRSRFDAEEQAELLNWEEDLHASREVGKKAELKHRENG